jgi:probable rRNA maturation factor
MTVFVRNRQRRLKIDREHLQHIALETLRWLKARADTTVGIILVSDAQIAEYNERFHRTAGPTDVLTFPMDEMAGGELIISADRALEHARRYRTTPARELALYVVHGILHLHGYDDRTARQRARMRAAERRLLARLWTARMRRP